MNKTVVNFRVPKDLRPVGEWIECQNCCSTNRSAKLPPYDQRVLVYCPKAPADFEPHYYCAVFENDFEGACWRVENGSGSTVYLQDFMVSHWMLLPVPPPKC